MFIVYCQKVCRFTFSLHLPHLQKANMVTSVVIPFTYLGNKHIYCNFKTCCTISLLFHTQFCFLTIKPTRCTNISNLFLKWNSTCFGQFLCPSWGVFHCTHSNGICHTGLLTARKLSTNLYDISLLCLQWKTPDDGRRNCLKHVEFQSNNKFE
jgi:hypothetical protein